MRLILPLLIFLFIFNGCSKDDFTWNIKKRPCHISFGTYTNDYFMKVSIANMNNETQGSGPANFYENKPIILKRGNNYSLNVKFSLFNEAEYATAFAYFDWNGDGDFLDSEESVLLSNDINVKDVNITIAVPSSANLTKTYARFILQSGYYPIGGNDPCFSYVSRGEVEDYPLEIIQE